MAPADRHSERGGAVGCASPRRFALFGLLIAAAVFIISGGHLLFLPLFFLLPLGGLFGHRRRYGRR